MRKALSNKTIQAGNMDTPDKQNPLNPVNSRITDLSDYSQHPPGSAIICEMELIPVVAGECRAEPTSITTVERSLIRSSSAEVMRNVGINRT